MKERSGEYMYKLAVSDCSSRFSVKDQALRILSQHPLFESVSGTALEELVSLSTTSCLERGEVLFVRKDPADSVYVVIEGQVALEIISDEGRQVRLDTLHSGDVFGEFAVLDEGGRTADARALCEVRLLRIGKSNFLEMIVCESRFALAIIKDLVNKIRQTDDKMEDMMFRPLRQRLAMLLLELAYESGRGQQAVTITQAEIAERLSATREKVNTHLQTLRRSGAIGLHRGKIEFLDCALLGHADLSKLRP